MYRALQDQERHKENSINLQVKLFDFHVMFILASLSKPDHFNFMQQCSRAV